VEIAALRKLLQSKGKLGERQEIQKFFKKRKQLSAFSGTFAPPQQTVSRQCIARPGKADGIAEALARVSAGTPAIR
jgi:hypothetical protein